MSGAAVLDPAAFVAEVAGAFSAQFGGPYFAGRVIDQTEVEYDAGGDVIPGTGVPRERGCSLQVDTATYQMQRDKGWVEGTMACIILVATLSGDPDTDATVVVDGGPHIGKTWQVSGLTEDAMGTHWVGKAVEA